MLSYVLNSVAQTKQTGTRLSVAVGYISKVVFLDLLLVAIWVSSETFQQSHSSKGSPRGQMTSGSMPH